MISTRANSATLFSCIGDHDVASLAIPEISPPGRWRGTGRVCSVPAFVPADIQHPNMLVIGGARDARGLDAQQAILDGMLSPSKHD